jgi:hypothetical protein
MLVLATGSAHAEGLAGLPTACEEWLGKKQRKTRHSLAGFIANRTITPRDPKYNGRAKNR